MNILTIESDIKLLKQALKKVEKTKNYMHFNKSILISNLWDQINTLQDKRERQISFINNIHIDFGEVPSKGN